jgi:cytosine/adenosine deaminase-related metal-dependent hydrolase
MRRIGANYIITNTGKALRNAYLEIDSKGTILQVVESKGSLQEIANLEFYNGVLVPGFVNTHAHLELSYMKNAIKPHEGLPRFISSIREIRQDADHKTIQKAIKEADWEMQQQGIVLVGDISNTSDTLYCKKTSPIEYKTFVEIFGMDKYQAYEIFEKASLLQNEFKAENLEASITPHAPYSVSEKLFELITEYSYQQNASISIHNQETESENQMFIDKTGELVDMLKNLKVNLNTFYPTNYNSLPSVLVQLPKCSKLNLVHNIYTQQTDIDKVLAYNAHSYWTLCPNANLYIENQLPPIDILYKMSLNYV